MKNLFMPTGDLIKALEKSDTEARLRLSIAPDVDTVFEYAIAKINQLTEDNDNLRSEC